MVSNPTVWITAGSIAAPIVAALVPVFRDKVRARRDAELLRLALDGSTPEQRREIIDGLANLRPFYASGWRWWQRGRAIDAGTPDDEPVPAERNARRRR